MKKRLILGFVFIFSLLLASTGCHYSDIKPFKNGEYALIKAGITTTVYKCKVRGNKLVVKELD